MKQLPVSSKYYLCEDVRHEIEGRVSLVGLFAADEFRTAKLLTEEPTALDSITIYAVFFGGRGTFRLAGRFIDSKGDVTEMGPPEEKTLEEKPHAFTVRFRPFQFVGYGEQRIELSFDETVYTYTFNILPPREGAAE